MIIKRLIPLLALIAISISTSCNHNTKRLKDVDAIIESDPQTAMLDLERIPTKELSADEYAFFCLLYTQAQVKCNIEVSNDSLIRIARETYIHDNSDELKKRACFYNAKVSYNQMKYKESMRDALVAYEISKQANDHYWIAKSAELISDIFYATYNYSQSELLTLEAIDNYLLSDKIQNHRYAICDLASVYLNQNKDTKALLILDSIRNVILEEEPFDSSLYAYNMSATYHALEKNNQYEELKKMLPTNSDSLSSVAEVIDYYILKSYILNADNDISGATQLLSKAYSLDDSEKRQIRIMYASFEQCLNNGNYKQAALMSDTLLHMQSKIAEEVLKESVMGEQRDFYAYKASIEYRKAKSTRLVLALVIIAALVLLFLLAWIHRLRIRAKRAELETNLASFLRLKEQYRYIGNENKRLSEELDEKKSTVESLQKSIDNNAITSEHASIIIETLFREKWHTLNMLCNDYFELGDSENTKTVILHNIENELSKIRSRKSLKDIEVAVDKYMGNIMSSLREECGFLKEDDFTFLSLVFAGFSVRAVCLITDIKYKLFYLKRSRLEKRIAASDAPHKALFLQKIK